MRNVLMSKWHRCAEPGPFWGSIFYVTAQTVPVFIGLIAVPILLSYLGPDRFGILSLCWTCLIYLTVLDLGSGVATTKFIAEVRGGNNGLNANSILWFSLTVSAVLGVVGGLVLASVSHNLAAKVLHIPPQLRSEAESAFKVLAVGVPFVVATSPLRGYLEGMQRFRDVSIMRAVTGTCSFLLPVVGRYLEYSLPGILTIVMLANGCLFVAYGVLCLRLADELWRVRFPSRAVVNSIGRFAGWATVSTILAPIAVYGDRLLVAALLPVHVVGYYTAVCETAARLWILASSFARVLMPTFAATAMAPLLQRSAMYVRALRVLLVIIPCTALVVLFYADTILGVWLGRDFAIHGALPLRIVLCGVIVNSLASVPYVCLQATGRTDVAAKSYALMILPFFLGSFLMTTKFGINGAALVWTARMIAEAIYLFRACGTALLQSAGSWNSMALRRAAVSATVALMIAGIVGETVGGLGVFALSLLFIPSVLSFLTYSWFTVLDRSDRTVLRRVLLLRRT